MMKCVAVGRLTKDISEIHMTPNGTPIATMSIAVHNRKDDTTFLDLTLVGKTAEACSRYLSKGNMVYVEFVIKNNNYTNKDGQNVYGYKYFVSTVDFLQTQKKAPEVEKISIDDDLPF
nr:MAG TPA: Single strand binding protein [Caudoviricetes sp.]